MKATKPATPVEEDLPVSEPVETFDIVVTDGTTKEQFTARFMTTASMVTGVVAALTAGGFTVAVSATRKIDITEALNRAPTAKPAKKK